MRKIGLEDQPTKPMLSVYPGGTLRDISGMKVAGVVQSSLVTNPGKLRLFP